MANLGSVTFTPTDGDPINLGTAADVQGRAEEAEPPPWALSPPSVRLKPPPSLYVRFLAPPPMPPRGTVGVLVIATGGDVIRDEVIVVDDGKTVIDSAGSQRQGLDVVFGLARRG